MHLFALRRVILLGYPWPEPKAQFFDSSEISVSLRVVIPEQHNLIFYYMVSIAVAMSSNGSWGAGRVTRSGGCSPFAGISRHSSIRISKPFEKLSL